MLPQFILFSQMEQYRHELPFDSYGMPKHRSQFKFGLLGWGEGGWNEEDYQWGSVESQHEHIVFTKSAI